VKHLKTFETYLIQEYSKNDPIPELTHGKDKLAIFLMGSPAAGKSTFAKNFIQTRRPDIKTFSSDDVSLMFTKDPNVRHRGSGELNIKRIDIFMESGQSFIYDTTPTYSEDKVDLIAKAKEYGYKIVFVALITPLEVALKRNQERDRQASEEFLKHTYNTIWNKLKQHKALKPDSFYVITDLNNQYTFYKYDSNNETLLKRKGSQYV
jgi:predicted kinase